MCFLYISVLSPCARHRASHKEDVHKMFTALKKIKRAVRGGWCKGYECACPELDHLSFYSDSTILPIM